MRNIVFAIAAGAALFATPAFAGPAENKKLVLDMWREVFEAQNAALAPKYLAEGYFQHNPNAAQGLKGFQDYFGPRWKAKPVQPTLANPPVEVIAEGDLVVLIFKRPTPEPKDATKTYDAFWFDAFRVKDGKLVEHWDPATKPVAAPAAAAPAAPAPR